MFPRIKRAELDLDAIGLELMERRTELGSEFASAMADDDVGVPADDADEREGSGRSRGGLAARDPEA
jgi:hypothetical protein